MKSERKREIYIEKKFFLSGGRTFIYSFPFSIAYHVTCEIKIYPKNMYVP